MWCRGGSLAPVAVNIRNYFGVLTPLTPAQCFNNPCHIRYLKLYEEAVSSPGQTITLASDWPPLTLLASDWFLPASPQPLDLGMSRFMPGLLRAPGPGVGMLFYPALGGASRLIQTEISSKIWRITQTCYSATSLHLGGHTSLATRCGGLTFSQDL